jgi:DHA1 family multidrug resistance protein-like MFS transporter
MSRSLSEPRRLSALLAQAAAWMARWRTILPILVAEFILWVGFGSLLPVMPLYFTDRGIDVATFGLIAAAWPAARLVGEPVFGWLADRTSRRPLMIGGLVAAGLVTALPLFVAGAPAFILLRALAGLATAAYDPSARGFLADTAPAERRGEVFGTFGAAAMAGLLLGPALGGVGAAVVGDVSVVFVFAAASAFLAALALAILLRDRPPEPHGPMPASPGVELPPGLGPHEAGELPAEECPPRLWNRLLLAAIALNFGGFFAAGTYEVVWSLYLTHLGAGLDLIGLTFALFALPILLLSPFAGRLVDRGGGLLLLLGGPFAAGVCGILYTLLPGPVWSIPVILIEGLGFAFSGPALYALVVRGSPRGRASTAQGVFGAAGTLGFIIASLVAGVLYRESVVFPFYAFAAVMAGCLLAAVLIGGRRLAAHPVSARAATEPRRAPA